MWVRGEVVWGLAGLKLRHRDHYEVLSDGAAIEL